jgi:alanine racemase
LAVKPATLEIDCSAVVTNWRDLARRHGAMTGAAIKADAYGLGAAAVAPALLAAGCRHFFVAHLDEALALRPLLPDAWIAVLNGAEAGSEPDFIRHDLRPVLNGLGDLFRWQAFSHERGQPLPAVLHIDTGMARLGLDCHEYATLIAEPERRDGVTFDYVMTHLIAAEQPDAAQNTQQASRFATIRRDFPDLSLSFANSAGIFLDKRFKSDLARPGYALYGGNPTPGLSNPMRNVVRLTAPVLQVRAIKSGDSVGYNATWRASRPTRIATVGIGYADGFPRALSSATCAFLEGTDFDEQPIPLVGRVSMDLITFDITDFPAIGPGAQLELLGPKRGIDALAADAGTSGYEILTSLGRRYQRVYLPA